MAKNRPLWTYRERGRVFFIALSIPVLFGLVVGIILLATEGQWMILIFSIAGLIGVAIGLFDNERQNR